MIGLTEDLRLLTCSEFIVLFASTIDFDVRCDSVVVTLLTARQGVGFNPQQGHDNFSRCEACLSTCAPEGMLNGSLFHEGCQRSNSGIDDGHHTKFV